MYSIRAQAAPQLRSGQVGESNAAGEVAKALGGEARRDAGKVEAQAVASVAPGTAGDDSFLPTQEDFENELIWLIPYDMPGPRPALEKTEENKRMLISKYQEQFDILLGFGIKLKHLRLYPQLFKVKDILNVWRNLTGKGEGQLGIPEDKVPQRPKLLWFDFEGNLLPTYYYLVNVVGIDDNAVRIRPLTLTFSLNGRIRPRNLFFAFHKRELNITGINDTPAKFKNRLQRLILSQKYETFIISFNQAEALFNLIESESNKFMLHSAVRVVREFKIDMVWLRIYSDEYAIARKKGVSQKEEEARQKIQQRISIIVERLKAQPDALNTIRGKFLQAAMAMAGEPAKAMGAASTQSVAADIVAARAGGVSETSAIPSHTLSRAVARGGESAITGTDARLVSVTALITMKEALEYSYIRKIAIEAALVLAMTQEIVRHEVKTALVVAPTKQEAEVIKMTLIETGIDEKIISAIIARDLTSEQIVAYRQRADIVAIANSIEDIILTGLKIPVQRVILSVRELKERIVFEVCA